MNIESSLQVVGAVIVENGRVFAAKRGESRYPYVAHKYEFAGGKIEAGESPSQALARELREELAMNVNVLSHYMTVTHQYPDFAVTLHTFLCQRESDYALLEHESADWIALDELDPDEWAPADKPILLALMQDPAIH